MTGSRKVRRVVWSPSGTWITVLDYIGRGALRGIRLENLAGSGVRVSGTDRLRITVDRLRIDKTGGYVLGSGMVRVPYLGDNVGQYLNLAEFVMSADYHEAGLLVSGSDCSCINDQRVPFHENVLVEYYLYTSGSVPASGIDMTVWFEGKGETSY